MNESFPYHFFALQWGSYLVVISYLEFPTPGAKPPDAPGPPPPLRGRGRGIEAPRPPGAGDFLSETPGDAGAILLHK